MAITPSAMLALGTPCPDFNLPDTDGHLIGPHDFSVKQPLLVMFICNHCPYVKHIRAALAVFGRDYAKHISIIAINANDAEAYPDDSPEKMVIEKREAGYIFPYLYDESQNVAKAFNATCTPEFYLFDNKRKLVYRGQFDDSRPGNGKPILGNDLRAAVDAVLNGQPIHFHQKPSVGCSIKWKPETTT
ncbi:MAG: thioredoxin family protein [Deltaproteobacteria bacterium]|nr:thioredoxin family protein [Deltaproteobacteria bacterium]